MSLEKTIAGFLRYGAFLSVFLCVVGIAWLLAAGGLPSLDVMKGLDPIDLTAMGRLSAAELTALAGLAALVAVSIGRLLLCAVMFGRMGDRRFVAISIVTVVMVAAAALFRLM